MLQRETLAEIRKLPAGTVAAEDMQYGVRYDEPLLIAMDAMLRYAKAYKRAYDAPVGDDGVLGPEFTNVVRGLHKLLNGQGGAAMESNRGTDSKDNGTLEELYWITCRTAAIEGDY